MKRIFLVVILLCILSEGVGNYAVKKLKVLKPSFSMAYGFAILLGLLQLLYYPILLVNGPFTHILIITSLVLLGAFCLTILSWKETLHSFIQPKVLLLIGSSLFFLFVFSKLYIDLEFSDSSTYLNYIALNINAPHLNLYNLTNGLRGPEWNIYYLFQGYFHFVSYICYIVNIPYYLLGSTFEVPNMVITIWGCGLLYHILSSSLILSVVDSLKIENKFFYYALLLFGFFYSNFYYWNISFAWYGNTFRSIFLMGSIYCIYQWEKENNSNYKYLILFFTSAALACSSSSLFMSFAILYACASYFFYIKKENALEDMLLMIFPMVCYVCAFLHTHVLLSVIVMIAYLVILLQSFKKNSLLKKLEAFFFHYAKEIFFLGIPILFMIGSLLLHFTIKNDFTSYLYYFKNYRLSDMIMDYTFLHSEPLEFILNVLRWLGVILVIQKKDSMWLRSFCIIMLVFFLNPLCTILLQMTITGMVFYRNFMVLYNPITEIIFFYYIYQRIENKKLSRICLSLILVGVMLMGNICSFFPEYETGLYWVYVRGGKDVDSIYKMDYDEYVATMELRHDILGKNFDSSYNGQPVVISQSNATLSYIPSIYQVFTSWHYHYPLDRINEELYQIQKKPSSWIEEEPMDYSNTCELLKKYEVDYILLQYWDSKGFDEASDACFVTFYTGSKYKVKKSNYSMR